MKTADASVVVGMITGMTPSHMEMIEPELALAEATETPILVPEGAFVEAEWVLRRRYGLARREIAGVLQTLLDSASFEAWDPMLATYSLRIMADDPRLDLADCLLAARHVMGEGQVLTFDKSLARTIDRLLSQKN